MTDRNPRDETRRVAPAELDRAITRAFEEHHLPRELSVARREELIEGALERSRSRASFGRAPVALAAAVGSLALALAVMSPGPGRAPDGSGSRGDAVGFAWHPAASLEVEWEEEVFFLALPFEAELSEDLSADDVELLELL